MIFATASLYASGYLTIVPQNDTKTNNTLRSNGDVDYPPPTEVGACN